MVSLAKKKQKNESTSKSANYTLYNQKITFEFYVYIATCGTLARHGTIGVSVVLLASASIFCNEVCLFPNRGLCKSSIYLFVANVNSFRYNHRRSNLLKRGIAK